MYGKSHQSVSICRGKIRTFQQLFDGKTMKLRRHLSATTKDARDPHLLQRHFLTQRFQ